MIADDVRELLAALDALTLAKFDHTHAGREDAAKERVEFALGALARPLAEAWLRIWEIHSARPSTKDTVCNCGAMFKRCATRRALLGGPE